MREVFSRFSFIPALVSSMFFSVSQSCFAAVSYSFSLYFLPFCSFFISSRSVSLSLSFSTTALFFMTSSRRRAAFCLCSVAIFALFSADFSSFSHFFSLSSARVSFSSVCLSLSALFSLTRYSFLRFSHSSPRAFSRVTTFFSVSSSSSSADFSSFLST